MKFRVSALALLFALAASVSGADFGSASPNAVRDRPVTAVQSLEPVVVEVPVGDDYVLGPGDFLNVFVENWNYAVQVGPDGSVTLEEIGTRQIAGKTLGEARELLLEALSAKYRKEFCFVSLARLKRLAVPVSGAVANPQTVRVESGMRLSAAVAAAGGTVGAADDHHVKLFRGSGTIEINLIDVSRKGDLSQDPVLQQGDRIFVPWFDRSRPQISVGLAQGGTLLATWDENLTAEDYLAWAGQLDASNGVDKILVTHSDGKVETHPFADVAKIRLSAGDRIELDGTSTGEVFVGGAVQGAGPLPYKPGWKVVDYLKAAGVMIVAADVRRVKVIKANGDVRTVSSIEEPVGPGDFIRLDKAAIEYVKDWATIVTAVISVVYTIVLINETTKD